MNKEYPQIDKMYSVDQINKAITKNLRDRFPEKNIDYDKFITRNEFDKRLKNVDNTIFIILLSILGVGTGTLVLYLWWFL